MKRKQLFLEQYEIHNVKVLGYVDFDYAAVPLEMHTHPDAMEFCYMIRGQQSYVVQNQTYILKGSEIFLTYPNEEHCSGTMFQEKSRLYYIIVDTVNNRENFLGFQNYEAAPLAEKLQNIPNRHFRGSPKIRLLLEDIFKTVSRPSPLTNVLLRAVVLQLLYETLMCRFNIDIEITPDISKTVRYISENIEKALPLELVARISGLSLPRFKQKFRQQLGVPPGEYIMRKKISRAQELLGEEISITDIAHQLNFSSSQHLSVAFKKYCGVTPREYRRKIFQE